MKIIIKSLVNKTFFLKAEKDSTILSIKEKINELLNINESEQIISYRGKILSDNETLLIHSILDCESLFLFVRKRAFTIKIENLSFDSVLLYNYIINLSKILSNNTKRRYEGEYEVGHRHGYGIFYSMFGCKYVGEWKNNKIHGKGVYTYINGKYEGSFIEGKRNGFGRYFFIQGEIYSGQWKDNKKWGHGVYLYCNGNKYEGEWVNCKCQGLGKIYFKNGDIYEGEWNNSKMNGKGIYYFINGDRYEGEWKENKKDGKGIYYFKSGDILVGEWKENKRTKDGVLYKNKYKTCKMKK